MEFTHKVGLITFLKNGASKINEITFVSECGEYKEAVLAMIHKRPEWRKCLPYEPVTKSPITFDITVSYKYEQNSKPFNSDQFFLTCDELIEFCESVVNEDHFVSFVTPAFCRTLFSNAGTLDSFYKLHLKGYKPKTYLGVDSIFHNKKFSDFDRTVFQSIKCGAYHKQSK
ncbi:hypothetical protein ABLB47_02875 [Vibrio parahaemolyticus]